MPAASLLALLDDIATILDDVALMSKVAVKKTAGVLGDDLALNAQQVAGVAAERELPVVWAVARGSLVNKAVLVPAALAVSTFAPWAVTGLLMLGGTYLCFEGVEKLAHRVLHPPGTEAAHREALREALRAPAGDLVALEADKIKGAVRTDFVLSAEIIVIALGTVADASFAKQVGVLVSIGFLMTCGVYGLVAAIVKLDDAGLYLGARKGEALWARLQRRLGTVLLALAPQLMKVLSVAGTVAMFLVGGGILVHGSPWLHHLAEHTQALAGPMAWLASPLFDAVVGVLAGAVVLGTVEVVRRSARTRE